MATVSSDGRNVDVNNTFERPLSVAVRDLFLHTKPGIIGMRQSEYSGMDVDALMTAGELSAALKILHEVNNAGRVSLGLAISNIEDAIDSLTGLE